MKDLLDNVDSWGHQKGFFMKPVVLKLYKEPVNPGIIPQLSS